jgi:maltose alpha-D-glucosyltransferase/alpha-amylase
MQWSRGRTGGFSTAAPEDLVRPVQTGGRYGARQINVQSQRADADSLLRWFEELIRVLRECPEIGVGDIQVIGSQLPRSVLAHRFDAPEGSILLLHNLSETPASLDLGRLDGDQPPYEVFSDQAYDPIGRRLDGLQLGPYGYRWIRLRRGA